MPQYDHELPRALGASCSSCRSWRSPTSPRCSTTSPRAAAAITRELGAVDAEAFCLEQGLSRYDARLVAWLVQNHLELSVTAQKQDIGDPRGHQRLRAQGRRRDAPRLSLRAHQRGRARHESEAVEFLEGLAVPGVLRAREARAAARPRKPDRPGRADARDAGRRAQAARRSGAHRRAEITRAWERLTAAYFLRHTPEEVAWHTQLLAEREPGSEEPLVAVRAAQRARHHRRARVRAAPRRTASRAPPRCSTSSASPSSMRASRRPATASASTSTTCSKTTARRSPTRERIGEIERALWRSLQRPGRCAGRGHAARAAPGAHVPHADADRGDASTSATTARCSS